MEKKKPPTLYCIKDLGAVRPGFSLLYWSLLDSSHIKEHLCREGACFNLPTLHVRSCSSFLKSRAKIWQPLSGTESDHHSFLISIWSLFTFLLCRATTLNETSESQIKLRVDAWEGKWWLPSSQLLDALPRHQLPLYQWQHSVWGKQTSISVSPRGLQELS